MDHVVVDVEIQRTIEEVGGWDATEKMGVAVACVWEYAGRRMRVYGPDDVPALRERLLAADRISGYNILNFDFPVIWGTSKAGWRELDNGSMVLPAFGQGLKTVLKSKTDDMLRRIWTALGIDPDNYRHGTHGSCKLDDVAGTTLKVRKIGNGADAPRWYQAGQVQRVVNYCADDVAIERDLTDFVDQYGYVVVGGKVVDVPPWRVL